MFLYLSKSTESTTPRVNPNISYGFWVYMIYQHRFISCNKCIQLGDADNGGGYAYVGTGSIWEISVPFSQFSMKLKLFFKNEIKTFAQLLLLRIIKTFSPPPAPLGLRCCARAFSSCSEQGLLFVAEHGL